MNRTTLSYQADGLRMQSELFFEPGARPKAGVLVFPEAYGLNRHALSRAEKLATMGYAALACDLHGNAHIEEDLGKAIDMLASLYADPEKTRARAAAGLHALAARSEVDPARIGAIGFCFGGTMALELARSGADVKAVVGFHSGLMTAAPTTVENALKARILVCIGGDDPLIPAEQRRDFEAEMRGANVDWQIHVYGRTVHSFTNPDASNARRPDAVRYNELSDRRSWLSMQQLFSEALSHGEA
jgi:dienelactone hydrolase